MKRVEELFDSALAVEAGRRAAFISEHCDGDEELCAEVESLFAAHEKGQQFFAAPAFDKAAKLLGNEPDESIAGRRIGAYEIICEIGHGGMGAVYLAARADDQYRQQVAIKLVKQGADNQFIVDRFLAERQILADLDHPNIARLLDGGTTEDCSPYLVMEYIEGKPIDDYCDERKLSTIERLKLFRAVCSAVQYAHQNLVIHRDIKPSNILVTGEGAPKLLDFGIAKILSPETTAQTLARTATAVRLMTPDYASPEQVRGETITTSSDVYSLGVLLYRLLTGHRPYHFKTPLPQEIERVICESEPEKPSTMITRTEQITTAEGTSVTLTPEQVGNARSVQPEKLRRVLSGDLDNIVLMTLRKEPARRYSSVEQFSDDIRRHLEGLPVIARKDTFGYRSGKFIKRHKVGVAAAALIVLTLVGGIVATIWQARIARVQRDKARIEAAKAERVSKFLQDMLASPDPASKGPKVTVMEVLNDAAPRVESDLADQPEVMATVQRTIGTTYGVLGDYDAAEPHIRSALELNTRLYGEEHIETAKSIQLMAALYHVKGDFAQAEPLYKKAIDIRRRLSQEEDSSLAELFNNYGLLLNDRGEGAAAEPLYREALAIRRKIYGDEHPSVATSLNNLALLCQYKGDLEGAEQLYLESIAICRKVTDRAAQIMLTTNLQNLGGVLKTKGDYQQAESLLREGSNFGASLARNLPWLPSGKSIWAICFSSKANMPRLKEKQNKLLRFRSRHFPLGILISPVH